MLFGNLFAWRDVVTVLFLQIIILSIDNPFPMQILQIICSIFFATPISYGVGLVCTHSLCIPFQPLYPSLPLESQPFFATPEKMDYTRRDCLCFSYKMFLATGSGHIAVDLFELLSSMVVVRASLYLQSGADYGNTLCAQMSQVLLLTSRTMSFSLVRYTCAEQNSC